MVIDESELTKEDLERLLKEKLENLKELEKFGKNSNYIQELGDVALTQLKLEKFSDAESNYYICLKHFEKQKDRLGQADIYGLLGTLNFQKGDFLKSTDYYQKANKVYEELKQIQEHITCLKGIGNSLIKLNKFEEAINIFLDCCALASDNYDIYSLLDCLSSLIFIYERMEKWDVLFELYKKVLNTFKEVRDNQGIISSYFNLGILQKKNNKLNDAIKYFKKGTNLAIDSNYSEMIIKGLSYIGETFFYLGEIKKAKNQYMKALYLANKLKAKNAIIQLKVLLNSLGLQDGVINNELRDYQKNRKN